MRIAISADHRGSDVLPHIVNMLEQDGHSVVRIRPCEAGKMCDYPDMAYEVGEKVASGETDRGILVCGSGIGMCIAANKVRKVRAAPVHDEIGAEISRRYNDANVLCLAADLLGLRVIERIVQTWLRTEFEGGRHARRVNKITAIEEGLSPQQALDPTPLAE